MPKSKKLPSRQYECFFLNIARREKHHLGQKEISSMLLNSNNKILHMTYVSPFQSHSFSGLEESSGKINSLTDFKAFEIYENQRWNLKHGFSNVLLPTDRPPWSDITGLIKLDKVKVTLPSANFSWVSTNEIFSDRYLH